MRASIPRPDFRWGDRDADRHDNRPSSDRKLRDSNHCVQETSRKRAGLPCASICSRLIDMLRDRRKPWFEPPPVAGRNERALYLVDRNRLSLSAQNVRLRRPYAVVRPATKVIQTRPQSWHHSTSIGRTSAWIAVERHCNRSGYPHTIANRRCGSSYIKKVIVPPTLLESVRPSCRHHISLSIRVCLSARMPMHGGWSFHE